MILTRIGWKYYQRFDVYFPENGKNSTRLQKIHSLQLNKAPKGARGKEQRAAMY